MSLHKHFCCPHCAGVIFYTGAVDPVKDELENSKVMYAEKQEYIRRVMPITHEQAANIVMGSWKTINRGKRKDSIIGAAWAWWSK